MKNKIIMVMSFIGAVLAVVCMLDCSTNKEYVGSFFYAMLFACNMWAYYDSKSELGLNNITITSKQLENIQNLLEIQANNIDDEYMLGLYNGMELVLAIVEKRKPIFASEANREMGDENDNG